jgi:hypothetical protein
LRTSKPNSWHGSGICPTIIDDQGDGSYGGTSDLDQDRTNNVVNEITGITETGGQTAWAAPSYSARGNMTVAPKPTSLANTYSCKYDAWNRLVEITSGTSDVVAKYEYDGLNRRTKKHVDTSAPGSPDGTIDEYRHFFYDNQWRIVETCNSSSENTEPESLQR